MTSQEKTLKLPKDIISHLGTFVEGKDLINFFLISKAFNENTSHNYHFWYKKLLKEFNFCYSDVYNLSIIQLHYRILYQAKMFGLETIRGTLSIINFPPLRKYIEDNVKIFSFRCQYVFARGKDRGCKCPGIGQRYGKYIFCSNCIKKTQVQQMINN